VTYAASGIKRSYDAGRRRSVSTKTRPRPLRTRSKRKLGAPVLAAAIVGLLLVSAMANGTGESTKLLVLNRSMAGVKIGNSISTLHRVLGPPKAVRNETNEITGSMRLDIYGKLSFSSYDGSVLAMKTTRRRLRTKSGIGVGVTKRRLERRFPGMSCYGQVCTIVAGGGLATIGKRVTSFRIRHGVVRVVIVGRVID
jgi:hypothetical protein